MIKPFIHARLFEIEGVQVLVRLTNDAETELPIVITSAFLEDGAEASLIHNFNPTDNEKDKIDIDLSDPDAVFEHVNEFMMQLISDEDRCYKSAQALAGLILESSGKSDDMINNVVAAGGEEFDPEFDPEDDQEEGPRVLH